MVSAAARAAAFFFLRKSTLVDNFKSFELAFESLVVNSVIFLLAESLSLYLVALPNLDF